MLGRDPAAESFIAVFTNKADEIATHLDNWSIRERILSVQYVLAGALEQTPVLDDEDVRQIAGTMGRFPAFRCDGWQLLRSACVLGDRTEP